MRTLKRTYGICVCCKVVLPSLSENKQQCFHRFEPYCSFLIWSASEKFELLRKFTLHIDKCVVDSEIRKSRYQSNLKICSPHPTTACSTATAPWTPIGPRGVHSWRVPTRLVMHQIWHESYQEHNVAHCLDTTWNGLSFCQLQQLIWKSVKF